MTQPNQSLSKLRQLLETLECRRGQEYNEWLKNYDPDHIEFADSDPVSADDWQEFKRKFVSEINGEQVNPNTGMTNTEFLEYLRSGHREGEVYWDPTINDFVDHPTDDTVFYRY
jgi:hypothetical protein